MNVHRDSQWKQIKLKLKTDNLCCPRIGPGYIKDGDTYNESRHFCIQSNIVSIDLFRQEETIATAAAIARD